MRETDNLHHDESVLTLRTGREHLTREVVSVWASLNDLAEEDLITQIRDLRILSKGGSLESDRNVAALKSRGLLNEDGTVPEIVASVVIASEPDKGSDFIKAFDLRLPWGSRNHKRWLNYVSSGSRRR